MPFIFVSCLIALTGYNCLYNLNRCDENRHHCLVLNFCGESMQSFTFKYDVGCVFFGRYLSSGRGSSILLLVSKCFYHDKVLEFVKCFF